MNAADQAALAAALERAGIHVEQPEREGAKIVRWVPIPAAAAIASWQIRGWRVWLDEAPPASAPPATHAGPTPHFTRNRRGNLELVTEGE